MQIKKKVSNNTRWHKVEGVLDIDGVIDYLKQVYNTSELEKNMNVFWDLLEADLSSTFRDDINKLKDFVSKHWSTEGKRKAAFVVPDDLSFGMFRMYELMMELDNLNNLSVFKDTDEAKKWILSDEI